MKDTKKSKEYLYAAYASMPDSLSLAEVRSIIQVAIGKLEHFDKVNIRKQINKEKEEDKKYIFTNVDSFKKSINTIDEMINDEKKKLEKFNKNNEDNEEIELFE